MLPVFDDNKQRQLLINKYHFKVEMANYHYVRQVAGADVSNSVSGQVERLYSVILSFGGANVESNLLDDSIGDLVVA